VKYGFVIDHRRCIGCHACTVACKAEHDVPLGSFRTWVKYIEEGEFPDTQRHFAVLRCNHCEAAPCIEICPVNALFKSENGIVDFDGDSCIGCKACMQACPYDALYINPSTNTAQKCNFCAHRVEVGLEPSCVVVCPEQAIIAGDMEDQSSHIFDLISNLETTVRKPEKGTRPQLHYIEADKKAITPSEVSREEAYIWAEAAGKKVHKQDFEAAEKKAARTVYDVAHERPWGWKVSAYLWTKSISAGFFLVAAMLMAFFKPISEPFLANTAPILSLVFLAITGLLLVLDLKRPERFYRLLLRPQWKSWLVIGGYIITAFGGVVSAWLLAHWIDWPIVKQILLLPGAILAVLTASYSAFLFAQARGRDFWQNPGLTSVHFLVQAIVAGAAAMWLGVWLSQSDSLLLALLQNILLFSLLANVLIIVGSEFGKSHHTPDAKFARDLIVKGSLSRPFWGLAVAVGNVIPTVLLLAFGVTTPVIGLAAVMSLVGLLAYEHIWVVAGQAAPLS